MDKYLDGLRSMRLYRQANTLPTISGQYQFTLKNVASYIMELDVGDRRGFSTFTLRGVPVFLVDAFNFLRLNGLDASGIFRKEGNINRLKSFSIQTFFGNVVLPEDCTTHDVCSLIKRFFRELKTPLFAQMQTKLLDAASIYNGAQRIEKLLEVVRMLPSEHLATLVFLMRQLKYIDKYTKSINTPLQEDLISNVRNENELRIAIIIDLIDNAHKIGVPRDYYLASRRPSDVSQKIFKGRFMGCVGMRSVSAKPSSRSAASTASVMQKAETRREKKLEKQSLGNFTEQHKTKIFRERRSSSTVRDFFSNISNKVLRRGLSPAASGRRRCSAGDLINEESLRENITGLDAEISKFYARRYADTCDIVQNTPRVKFENEELLPEKNVSSIKGHIISPLSIASSPQKLVFSTTQISQMDYSKISKDDTEPISTKSLRHRSRRESPRKSNTANSRSKTMEKCKVIKGLKEANMTPASPAFEPVEMTTKNIGEAFLKHKDSDEKLAVPKIIKRNSSKKLLQSIKIADSSQSFLEGYSTDKIIDRIHRRHTAPVKVSTLLKRNQPNSVTTGLKTPQSRIPERLSTTLSLKGNGVGEDSVLVLEKKKRHSESLSGDSNDKISADDDENDTTRKMQAFSAETLLEQKCAESRQRRAKRQKRQEANGSIQTISMQCTVESTPLTSLLDDVTNEINRLERDREFVSKLFRNGKNTFLFSNTTEKDHDLDSDSTKEDIPPSSLPSVPPPTDSSSLCRVPSVIKENHTELSSSPNIPKHSLYSSSSNTNIQSTIVNSSSSAVITACNKTFWLESQKHSSEQRVDSIHGSGSAGGNSEGNNVRPDDFGEDFSKSDAIKIQLLSARNEDDILAGPAYMPSGSRPSVLSIKSNNRGMVKQRVNHFARLGTPKNISEKDSKTGRQWQNAKYTSSSLQKLSAPPASHSLQPIASRETVMKQAKKFETLAASVGMEAYKNFRPATHNRFTKIQRQNNLKTPRRLSGEMRVMRRSQARLDKSLEKLAINLNNRRLLGRSPSQFGCNKFRSLSANSESEERRQNAGQPLVRVLCHGGLEYINPSIITCIADLKMISETKYDV
ncbi:unnamed protein product [Onchocerca flexuosa]|uniref:Rho-GAP domain-containing protein n=1 Tax=Onchocerca flexuosa TaxID=387005 RepID=A0A183H1U9_9BILA|nr:unnamed protein product [Onchocerca flexuosa]